MKHNQIMKHTVVCFIIRIFSPHMYSTTQSNPFTDPENPFTGIIKKGIR